MAHGCSLASCLACPHSRRLAHGVREARLRAATSTTDWGAPPPCGKARGLGTVAAKLPSGKTFSLTGSVEAESRSHVLFDIPLHENHKKTDRYANSCNNGSVSAHGRFITAGCCL